MTISFTIMAETRRIIGLTGGIATGKSTVTNYLQEHYSISVLDADILAREAVQPRSPMSNQIFQHFGTGIQTPTGNLDRAKLAEIIFNQPSERRWLEAEIHPFVRQRFEMSLEQNCDRILVFSIPLLFEAQMTDLVTEIWVVSCPLEMQINRLRQRNHLSLEQAIARIESQMPLAEKTALADRVIENDGALEKLYRQVDSAIAVIP
jgi:dephospho-CoA kinase